MPPARKGDLDTLLPWFPRDQADGNDLFRREPNGNGLSVLPRWCGPRLCGRAGGGVTNSWVPTAKIAKIIPTHDYRPAASGLDCCPGLSLLCFALDHHSLSV